MPSKKTMPPKLRLSQYARCFPRDSQTGAVDADQYLRRGEDDWVAVSWDDAFKYSAAAMANIAATYSGEDGIQRLIAQGYDPLTARATQGAGAASERSGSTIDHTAEVARDADRPRRRGGPAA